MKRTIVLAGVALTALAFNGCNNEAALKEAQDKFNARLTQVTDSLKGASSTELSKLQATCDSTSRSLTDTLAVRTAALEAAMAKKTGTTAKKPADPKTTGMDQKQKESYEQKKAKMGGH